RDAKAPQESVGGDAIAKINNVIDDGRISLSARDTELRVSCRQRYSSHGFKVNSIMGMIKPDQGLSFTRRPVLPGMNFNRFVSAIGGSLLQGVLNVLARINVITIGL